MSKEEINNNNVNNSSNGSLNQQHIDKYSTGNTSERQNNLVIISANNLPQTSSPQKSQPTPNADGKVARDSVVHVPNQQNEMFQFSDVESVQTADFFLKKTPQSSFESDDTYKSNSFLPSIIKSKNQKLSISSTTSHNPKDRPLSFMRSSFSKLPKINSNHQKGKLFERIYTKVNKFSNSSV